MRETFWTYYHGSDSLKYFSLFVSVFYVTYLACVLCDLWRAVRFSFCVWLVLYIYLYFFNFSVVRKCVFHDEYKKHYPYSIRFVFIVENIVWNILQVSIFQYYGKFFCKHVTRELFVIIQKSGIPFHFMIQIVQSLYSLIVILCQIYDSWLEWKRKVIMIAFHSNYPIDQFGEPCVFPRYQFWFSLDNLGY